MCAAKVQLAQANRELNLEQQQLRERLELVESLLFDKYSGAEGVSAPLTRVDTADSGASQETHQYGAQCGGDGHACRLRSAHTRTITHRNTHIHTLRPNFRLAFSRRCGARDISVSQNTRLGTRSHTPE